MFSIPIDINLSDDAPCAGIDIKFMLEDPNEPDLWIETDRKNEKGIGWIPYFYSIVRESCTEHTSTLLTPANTREEALESGCVIYNETIETFACMPEDVML